MIAGERRKLAVLGSPIKHSKSPALHQAAYSVLGLPWGYEAVDVSEDSLADFVTTRDDSWLGLSLTMPLKRAVLPLLNERDVLATITGSANTVLFKKVGGVNGEPAERVLSGFNTDVYGLAESFRQSGAASLDSVQILGGGATAASAIAAAALLSVSSVVVLVRDTHRALPLIAVGEALGIDVRLQLLSEYSLGSSAEIPDAIISTLPGGATMDLDFSDDIRQRSILFDVAYDPWPSELARSWTTAHGRVISGIHMLINQALIQQRIFVSGDVSTALPGEAEVLATMRAAVGVESLWDNS